MHLLSMPEEVAWGGESDRRAWHKHGKDARQWLQWIGSELGRSQVDPFIWINRVMDIVKNAQEDVIICSDGRTWDELNVPASFVSYATVRVVKDSEHLSTIDTTHSTESELLEMQDEDFDFVVKNNHTIEKLTAKAEILADYLIDHYHLV